MLTGHVGGHRQASLLNCQIATTIANYFRNAGLTVQMVSPATTSKQVLECSQAKMKKTRVRHFCKQVVRPNLVNGNQVNNEFHNQHETDALVQGFVFIRDK
jgi:hypothetical protein